MSNKDLDNLFKNKLEDFGKSPSKNLWDKIEGGLEEPKKKAPWFILSIAASLLLLLTFSIILFTNDNVVKEELAEVNSSNNKIDSNAVSSINKNKLITKVDDQKIEAADNLIVKSEQTAEKSNPVQVKNNKPIVIKPIKKEDITIQNDDSTRFNQLQEIIEEIDDRNNIVANKKDDATIAKENTSKEKEADKGKTLIFDISQFEKTTAVIATDDETKKESKLKKIFNKAMDIKEGESGLGDLRAAKNDLLAFNSKKGNNDSK
jgi:hypothetical protein